MQNKRLVMFFLGLLGGVLGTLIFIVESSDLRYIMSGIILITFVLQTALFFKKDDN